MPINITMPALSPRWRKAISPSGWSRRATRFRFGDVIAEIETDKATMEVEAVDEGTVAKTGRAGGHWKASRSTR